MNTISRNNEINNSKINNNEINNNKINRNSDFLTPQQACELLGVSHSTLRTMANEGKIECITTCGGGKGYPHRRFPKSEIYRLLGKYAPIEETAPPEAYDGFEEEEVDEGKVSFRNKNFFKESSSTYNSESPFTKALEQMGFEEMPKKPTSETFKI